jgi:hypothetical protein
MIKKKVKKYFSVLIKQAICNKKLSQLKVIFDTKTKREIIPSIVV